MKILTLLSFGLLVAGSASAASVEIFNRTTDSSLSYGWKFNVNQELGRAWIEIKISSDYSETQGGRSGDETVRIKVKGLSYDNTTKEIRYVTGDQSAVCANLEETSFFIFSSASIEGTGKCDVRFQRYEKKIDDGFNISKEERVRALFEAKKNP